MIIVKLIFNLALLISVSVLSGFFDKRWKHDTPLGVIVQGLLFGMVALLGMLNPFELAAGLFFDGRSVVLSLCALFFGPVAGMIAAAMALVYRLYIGGGGVFMGVSVILSSTLIGIIFHRYTKTTRILANTFYLYGIGLIVHIVMVLLMITLPSSMRVVTFNTVTLTILGVYPIATALIGKILKDQADSAGRKAVEDALRASENKFALFMEHLPAFAFIKDSHFKILYVNKSIDEVLGASAWMGLTPPEFFPGAFGEKLLADDQAAMRSGYVKVEEIVPDREGNVHTYETQKFLIQREGQEPWLGGIAIDITMRKSAEEGLKQKSAELTRFNNLMIGREIKMIELKQEINDLLVQAGGQPKYNVHA